ncbi:carbohydrate ABC transporter substrate-binding protein [Paenibacillus sp. IB182496]|uniref:Carbohydrate ABC transporter substrate-binding protein n=1 Tax=Paenibacillus sabuli TaxID=2772509 RepID=A0A927GSA7_9BACL|nr:ABC transporter substrate-binding protein [Paenibacillus sabuli]MBD2846539.1 carbohydrate ABC transporter substrate-binding protein [Paenibacillus sabuli]
MKKKGFLGVTLLTCLVLTSACGNNDSGADSSATGSEGESNETVNLRMVWWGNKEVHDRTQKVVELFEEAHPNIKVSTEFTGWGGYWDKLATQAAGQNLPDVVNMDLQYFAEYTNRGLLADLTPFTEQGILNFDDVDPALLEGGMVDGKLYAVSQGTNSYAMTYDPAMLEEAGVADFGPGYTWEQLGAIGEQVKAHYGSGTYVTVPQDLPAFGFYLRQHGAWIYNEAGDGLGYEGDQYLIDFLTMVDELRKADLTPPPDVVNSVQGLEDQLIVHKKSPFQPLTSNEFVAIAQAADRPLELTIFPSLEGGEPGQYLRPGQFYAVSANSEHPEEAAMLVDFFTNSEAAHEVLMGIYGVPISSKILSHITPLVDENTRKTFDYIELAKDYAGPMSPPDPKRQGEVVTAYESIQEEVSFGVTTPEEGAKRFRAEAEAVLSRNAQ